MINITKLKRVVFLLIAFFFLPLVASLEEIEEKNGELVEIKKEIEKKKKDIDDVNREEKSILGEISEMDKEMKKEEEELNSLNYKIETANIDIDNLGKKIGELEVKTEDMSLLIEKRLVALYKLGGSGYAPVLFSAIDYTDLKRRGKYLTAIIEKDRELFRTYRNNVKALTDNVEEVQERKDDLSLLKGEVSWKKKELKKEKMKREEYLEDVKDKKSSYEKVLEELKESEKRLAALIDRLKEEREKEAMKEHPHTSPASGGYFAGLKGKLPYPVKGTIISKYGNSKDPIYNNPIFNKGIEIKAADGTIFVAVAGGEVIYSDYFEGYGNLIIVDHGDSYYTLYAHANILYKGVGDKVVANDSLGTVGDTGSLKGPCLYFEIRHHKETKNPEGWLVKK